MKRIWMALVLVFAGSLSLGAAEKGDDGLHKTPWMRDTFKDLREDLDEANAEGKRLVLFIEQRGCIYCDKMHAEVYPNPELSKYIEDNYFVVQMNLHGNDTAVDFDGEEAEQADLMRKWGILFTPTLMFMPEEVPEGQQANVAAVSVMPGAFGFHTTYNMFVWVNEKRYDFDDGEDFQRYHARMLKERQAAKGE
ncbi:thioredoxin family protein [Alisedimentitalea sp. MJ-SS2]|uniref:thioredoxin family protein n=1 Tax=Aliisedimentitalea sp. MJ-SS2 TaxID=3049795 RepID=UPI00290C0D1B|nr:thioredoxin family protein [Alisedimentitalea sp. MJ-SS2]MDU8929068.1 thioredoxin family protein [Alisedimentitalea sp. MJ-SS2]